ncbi:MATE domain protein [Actinomyces naeslundii str. Howell 279]|uniref:MATE domain protein n=1 Tax=Actinomyces naeslundii (strain ATCC 12104 / DSM 43013 / CCUG 2238 / JCM 8349 / NCTC 10301 / Howell 279) TaxID=1115803 RepID=J3AD71_ACTNH|nr:MATE domain protein [Actinomyces naeslundii str. Howell 279]
MTAQQRRGGLLSVAGSVAGLTLVSRALGFLRWLVQAATVGTGTVAGAYTTANQLPNTLYEVVVGGVLAATVVPLLAAPIAAGRREEVTATASGLLGLVLAVLTPLSLVLIVFAAPIAALFPSSQGVDPALQHELVASFLRMFALQVPMYGVAVVLTGVLQAHNRFTWPALTPMLSSLVVMATYGLYGALADGDDAASVPALQVLGWGTTLRSSGAQPAPAVAGPPAGTGTTPHSEAGRLTGPAGAAPGRGRSMDDPGSAAERPGGFGPGPLGRTDRYGGRLPVHAGRLRPSLRGAGGTGGHRPLPPPHSGLRGRRSPAGRARHRRRGQRRHRAGRHLDGPGHRRRRRWERHAPGRQRRR